MLETVLRAHGAASLDWGRLGPGGASAFVAGDRTEEQLDALEANNGWELAEGVWAVPDDVQSLTGSLASWTVEEVGSS